MRRSTICSDARSNCSGSNGSSHRQLALATVASRGGSRGRHWGSKGGSPRRGSTLSSRRGGTPQRSHGMRFPFPLGMPSRAPALCHSERSSDAADAVHRVPAALTRACGCCCCCRLCVCVCIRGKRGTPATFYLHLLLPLSLSPPPAIAPAFPTQWPPSRGHSCTCLSAGLTSSACGRGRG